MGQRRLERPRGLDRRHAILRAQQQQDRALQLARGLDRTLIGVAGGEIGGQRPPGGALPPPHAPTPETPPVAKASETIELGGPDDYQLLRAIDLLRGVAFFEKRAAE